VQLEHIYVSLKVSEKSDRGMPLGMSMEAGEDEKIFDGKDMEKEMKRDMGVRRARVLDADTAVKNYHRLVVVGAPGAGKTTLLKHIALKSCKENLEKQERITVPIPVTLRDFAQSGKTMREYINHVFEKYRFPEAKESVEKDLKHGKCLLLLDGFDELAELESQDKTAKAIHEFTAQYPACRVLATSRIAGYHDELTGFTRTELMEFDDDQVKQFIDNWFGRKDKTKAASMLKAVTGNESIKHLAKNPLMIAIIAIIYEEDKELPRRRAALYERAVEVLLSKWDVGKRIKNRFPSEKKEFILRKLAFENHCLNRRTMSRQAILEIINGHASQIGLKEEDAEVFLEEIWQRSYLLREIAGDTFDFLHLSFQEYFTALELEKQEDGIGTIIEHISEPWWEEPILLYAGISGDAAPLIKRIQKEVPEDMFYSNLMLAGKCIADAEFTEPALKEEIIEKLWSFYNTGEYRLLKQRAMEVLSLVKPRHIIDALIKQLTDEDGSVRENAAYALGVLSIVEALPALLKALSTDKDSRVRGSAAYALRAIGSTEALPALLKALRTDEDCVVRESAADALSGIGGVDALPALLKVLRTAKSGFVRDCAANALRDIGSAEAIPALLKALSADKERFVRGDAASALGAIGSVEVIPALLNTLSMDNDGYVHVYVTEALGLLGVTDDLPARLIALCRDEDSYVRRNAAVVLGLLGVADALPTLLNALSSDEERYVRGLAASALGDLGSPEAHPALLKALSTDKECFVRWRVVSALAKIGDETAVQPLIKALEDVEDSGWGKVKDAAFEALEKIRRRVGKEKFEVQSSKFKV
jgi:HEAT repeat protein